MTPSPVPSVHRQADPSTAEVLSALSAPVEPSRLAGPDLSRRRFLQAAGVAGVVGMLPGWLAEAASAATPIGPTDGVLVLLTLAGGNDGLNTFVPIADGAYYAARPSLAIRPEQSLRLNDVRGLHPELGYMKALWDRGQVAVVEGVGHDGATLSHFVSMAQMMAANANGQPGSSGWLGRFLDGLPDEPLTGVSIGSRVPLVVQGNRSRAAAVPYKGNDLQQVKTQDPIWGMQYEAIRSMGQGATGLGGLADGVAGSFGEAVDLADRLRPLIPDDADEPKVATQLRLAAQLINANLGVRVISIMFGDFDSHANQASMHTSRMRELNAGLQAFYTTLDSRFADRTLLVGTSEFGRRVRQNSSGTDHGTANAMFAIGAGVKGGFHGQPPSLSSLDRHGNTVPTVDYRQFYSNLMTTWLGADSAEVLGQDWGDLGFLRAPGSGGGAAPVAPIPTGGQRSRRAEVTRLYLAYFGRHPDDAGLEHWAGVRESGLSLGRISAEFATSPEFTNRYGNLSNQQFVDLVYRNVLGRAPDGGGLNHWTGVLNQGTSRGDVMVQFSESNEFTSRTAGDVSTIEKVGPIGRLYWAYFLRAPDQAGLDHWLNTGLPQSAVSDQFASSAEFRNRYGALDNRAFVALTYRNVLGRDPDSSGLDYWVGALNRGTSRGRMMLAFANSGEFIRRVRSL